MTVETMTVEPENYRIALESYGTVQPRTRSMLVAQVGGQIVYMNPNVRDGGFFEQGDTLISIDSRDYAADVQIAEATLANARQALAEAEARTRQAVEDWQRLGNEGEAPALVQRIPQLEAAKAQVRSAESALVKAELSLERTNVVAPFAGRVLRKSVDLGQVVGPNAQLAEVYATDIVEIRLPLRNRDLPFVDLPESYRVGGDSADDAIGEVTITSALAGGETWDAELVRTESAIDETARQLHVIAQINDPFGAASVGRTPVKIGEYVTATLAGRAIDDALVIPNNTIYQGTYVYVVEEDLLRRRNIDIAWQNDDEAIISAGLAPGDALVTTPLGQVTSGIRVSVMNGEQGPDRSAATRSRPEGAGRGSRPAAAGDAQ